MMGWFSCFLIFAQSKFPKTKHDYQLLMWNHVLHLWFVCWCLFCLVVCFFPSWPQKLFRTSFKKSEGALDCLLIFIFFLPDSQLHESCEWHLRQSGLWWHQADQLPSEIPQSKILISNDTAVQWTQNSRNKVLDYWKWNFEFCHRFLFSCLQVMTEEDKTNPLYPLYIGPERLLSLFSENNWEDFCLSYLLTNRDYSGTLGLAWRGKPGESASPWHVHQLKYHIYFLNWWFDSEKTSSPNVKCHRLSIFAFEGSWWY